MPNTRVELALELEKSVLLKRCGTAADLFDDRGGETSRPKALGRSRPPHHRRGQSDTVIQFIFSNRARGALSSRAAFEGPLHLQLSTSAVKLDAIVIVVSPTRQCNRESNPPMHQRQRRTDVRQEAAQTAFAPEWTIISSVARSCDYRRIFVATLAMLLLIEALLVGGIVSIADTGLLPVAALDRVFIR